MVCSRSSDDKPRCGRPSTARNDENIAKIPELVLMLVPADKTGNENCY